MPCLHSRKPDGRRGFTLLELLIYIAIISVVLIVATKLSSQVLAVKAKSTALSEVNRNARFVMDRIVTEVGEADAIAAGTVFGTNPGRLELTVTDLGNSPTVFAVTDGTLTVQLGSGPALPLTSSQVTVTGFTLQDMSRQPGTRSVAVSLELQYRSDVSEYSAKTSTQATARIKRRDGFGN